MFPIRDHNPALRTAYVTYALIVMNVLVYLWGLAALQTDLALDRFYYDYAMIPSRLSQGQGYSGLITSMFLHGGFWHLAINMLFLWIFGDNVEDQLGHVGFAVFYLATGVGADLAQFAADPTSPIPTIGASGAIAGVMGGYLFLFPRAKVDVFIFFIVFFRIIPIPAWLMLGLWFALQLFSGVESGASSGVAYWAHAGGFVLGAIAMVPAWIRKGAAEYWVRTQGHPPHPEAKYGLIESRIPRVRRR